MAFLFIFGAKRYKLILFFYFFYYLSVFKLLLALLHSTTGFLGNDFQKWGAFIGIFIFMVIIQLLIVSAEAARNFAELCYELRRVLPVNCQINKRSSF